MASSTAPRTPLKDVVPKLSLGSAPFNYQMNSDPYGLPVRAIVKLALQRGIHAFDTSPYYGPAEELFGDALTQPDVKEEWPRSSYFLSTKVGRIEADIFDYSPEWIRKSVARSLERLKTEYLDMLVCHDVEFVTKEEVYVAVGEVLKLVEEGKVRYVAISGYPTSLLVDLAVGVRERYGRPLDGVLSYAHQTLQNGTLISQTISKFKQADVDVVFCGAPLAIGLLRAEGVPIGTLGDFHPAPAGLREASHKANQWAIAHGEKLSYLASRYAAACWIPVTTVKGVSVVGVSTVEETEQMLDIFERLGVLPGSGETEGPEEKERYETLFKGVQDQLGEWLDYSWQSPSPEYKRGVK